MKGAAEAAYRRLMGEREGVLDKARECSSLTIPYILPPEGTTPQTKLPTPYQGTGAEGVNNIASKLSLTLWPNHRPSFMFVVDPARVQELAAEAGANPEQILTDVQADLSVLERTVQNEIERRQLRPALNEELRHLVISGNGMLQWKPDGGLRTWGLDQYVAKRDNAGTPLWVVTKEGMDRSALPDGVEPQGDKKKQTLYSAMRRTDDGKYQVWQEINGVVFNPDTVDTFEEGPYILPRMFEVAGETYGRGLVEHYLGDLVSLEAITRAIVQATAAASKVVWMVNPNGFTNPRKLQKAVSGGYVMGSPEDVRPLQLEKNADLQTAFAAKGELESKLHRVFLLNTAAQRDAERVTAAEVRYIAQQLEDALGGVYTNFNDQLQFPIVNRVIADMEKQGQLPDLPEGVMSVRIVTGLEGLGRARDLESLRGFLMTIQEAFGPAALGLLDERNLMTRVAAAYGVDTLGLVKSEETVAQEQQAAQQAAIAEQVAAPIAGAVAKPVAEQTFNQ